jgi:hypothetical protein
LEPRSVSFYDNVEEIGNFIYFFQGGGCKILVFSPVQDLGCICDTGLKFIFEKTKVSCVVQNNKFGRTKMTKKTAIEIFDIYFNFANFFFFTRILKDYKSLSFLVFASKMSAAYKIPSK